MRKNIEEFIELNHMISSGMVTCPGYSDITINDWRQFDNGALVDSINFLGTTSTYIDAPYHVKREGAKISDYPLEKLVNIPIVVIRKPAERRMFLPEDFLNVDVEGKAVLLFSGNDVHFGNDEYGVNPPYLSIEGAHLLVEKRAALVGIDSVLIDDFSASETLPVHYALLSNNIIIAENMANIGLVEKKEAYLTAVPPRVPMSSFPVRIFATVY